MPKQTDQLGRILRPVVDAVHQRVLKGNPPARLLKITRAGLKQFRQRVALGDRHDALADLLRRRVQRHS